MRFCSCSYRFLLIIFLAAIGHKFVSAEPLADKYFYLVKGGNYQIYLPYIEKGENLFVALPTASPEAVKYLAIDPFTPLPNITPKTLDATQENPQAAVRGVASLSHRYIIGFVPVPVGK